MAKVAAYHTTSPEYPPRERNVYHDHHDCPDGRRIKPEHRRAGDAGRPRCDECKKKGRATFRPVSSANRWYCHRTNSFCGYGPG